MGPPSIRRVASLDMPALHPYLTLRRPHQHIEQGIFVAEGEKVVYRLLASDLFIESLLLTQEWYEQLARERLFVKESVPVVYIAEKPLLNTIVGYRLHQGIMAVAKVPEQKSLEKTLVGLRRPASLVALDGLMNSENVGAVVRNCAAFGVGAVVVGETSSSPYLRRAVRNSMGTVFQMPVVHVGNLVGALKLLRESGTRIVAAHPNGETPIHQADFGSNICIIFGNEDAGVSPEVLSVCDQRIAIPMMNNTDSLNVSSASAVFLHEAARQRSRQ